MKDLVDIFLQPGPVLARRYEKPDPWLPALLIAGVGTVFAYLYFSAVDMAWFFRESAERGGEELSQAQIDAMEAAAGGTATVWTSTISAPVVSIVLLMLWGVYFLLAGKLTGLAVSFKQGFALAAWSSMPGIIGSLLALYGTVGMASQTYIGDLMLTNLDPMLVQLPPESPWKSFATAFNFLNLWTIGLAALGWKLWSKDAGWAKPLVVAALPFALLHGYQIISALIA
ncbi:MAG: YIP1 family protein [Gammaproteobacteria bacterium]|jgi:hypothetical protein